MRREVRVPITGAFVGGATPAVRGRQKCTHRLAAVRGSINGLMAKVMEDHIRFHVADPKQPSMRKLGGDELIEIVNSYLR